MSTVPKRVTAQELLSMNVDDGRYELVHGELTVMSPAGGRHGLVAMRIGALLDSHVRIHKLGAVFAAETGFILSTNPDTVRAPDVAFATHEQLALIQDADSYLPFVPRLVVEVVSPSDSSSHVESKIDMWIAAGVKLALVADPVNQSLRVYRPKKGIEIVRRGGVLNADDAVAGWELAVDDIFS